MVELLSSFRFKRLVEEARALRENHTEMFSRMIGFESDMFWALAYEPPVP